MMDHAHCWSGNGQSQAFGGLHGSLVPPTPYNSQQLVDIHPAPWASAQEPGYGSGLGEPFVHTQHQKPIHAYGLPSPASTALAASPPDWSKHEVPSVAGCWDPLSPLSPTTGEVVGGGFNQQLDMVLYETGATTPPTFNGGFHGWTGNTNFSGNFDHTFSGVVQALPPVPADFNGAWHGGTVPVPTPPNGLLLQSSSTHSLPQNLADRLNSIPQTYPTQALPSPPCPPVKRVFASPQQHPSKRPRATDSLPTTAAPTPSTTVNNPTPAQSPIVTQDPDPNTISKPNAHPKSRSNRNGNVNPNPDPNPTGPTLRTAARRVKRPIPSPKPGESPEHQRARTNHNLVEQQYRHRLHARFEALLDVLPEGLLEGEEPEGGPDDGGSDGELVVGGGEEEGCDGKGSNTGNGKGSSSRSGKGSTSGKGKDVERRVGIGGKGVRKRNRRMSKVDVLSRAGRVIRLLEGDIERVRREVEGLRREREIAFAKRGLQVPMPVSVSVPVPVPVSVPISVPVPVPVCGPWVAAAEGR